MWLSLKKSARPLKPGDIVRIRRFNEIIETLDANGALDGLPFMPEMIPFCGTLQRVFKRAEQVCLDGVPVAPGESRVREFCGNDVVLLEALRCSGKDHDACKRGCLLFWKERWLQRPEDNARDSGHPERETGIRPASTVLPTFAPDGHYYCQSSELLDATECIPRFRRPLKIIANVRGGNHTPTQAVRQLFTWIYWKLRQAVFGTYPRGCLRSTPTTGLHLREGDWVEIKSLAEIEQTLDQRGCNRGLHFTPDMRLRCGQCFRVRSQTDRMIIEGTGEVRTLRNTVILEGATHTNTYYVFGGCPREEYQYWREIWLRPAQNHNDSRAR